MVECKYRGRVIGWLEAGVDGFLRYKPIRKLFMYGIGLSSRVSIDGGLTWSEWSQP